MTQHNHREHVEGCFRCELSKDEVPTDAEHIAWLDDEIQWLEHEMEKWEIENKRLRDGIRRHRDDINPQCVTSGDRALWALLDE